MPICVICGREYGGFGNNAWPVAEGQCCDKCQKVRVLPQRTLNARERDKMDLERALRRIFP
jgi:hypothetical protein